MNKISTALGIRPGEGRPTALLMAHSFFLGVTIIFFATTANAIFLAEFDASTLPYVYILSAVAVTIVGTVHARLESRLSPSIFLTGTILFLLLFVCLIRFGIWATSASWLIFGFLIWFRLIEVLLNLEFWGLPGRIFNVRQSKRLLGLIASGEVVARIIGGFSVPFLVALIGTPNLLFLAAGGLVFCLIVLTVILRQYPQQFAKDEQFVEEFAGDDTENLFKNRYVVLLLLLFIFAIAGNFFIEFVFFNQAQARYPDEDTLARFLGVFSGVAQFVLLLATTFFSGRLISRYGIQFGLLALPLLFGVSIALVAFTGAAFGPIGTIFWLVALGKLSEEALRNSFNEPSLRVLYTPIPAIQRTAAQLIVEGRGASIGAGLAGITLLLFMLSGADIIPNFTYIMLFVLVLWLVVAVLTYREYSGVLMRALAKRRIGELSHLLVDSNSVAVVEQGLESEHAGVVVYTLNILEGVGYEAFAKKLPMLLSHREEDVRLEVLRRIEQLHLNEALPIVQERLRYDGSLNVRGAALRVLATLGGPDTFDEAYGYLENPQTQFRLNAMIGLMRSGEIEGILATGGKLIELVNSPNTDERILAAQVLNEAEIRGFYRPLVKLLQDEDSTVIRSALVAAGKLQHPKTWPIMIQHLASSDVYEAAMKSLIAGGDAVLPTVYVAFDQHNQDIAAHRELLIRLAKICGRRRGPEVTAFLSDKIDFPDQGVRHQLLKSLSKVGYQAIGDEQASVHTQILSEVADATWLWTTLLDIDGVPDTALLQTAIHNALGQIQFRLFLLLSFIYDTKSILQAQVSFNAPSVEKRAYAIEIVDMLLGAELKPLLLSLLDELPIEERLNRLQVHFPQVQMGPLARFQVLAANEEHRCSPWVHACTLYTIAENNNYFLSAEMQGDGDQRLEDGIAISPELSQAILSALASPEALVRETALWTLAKLDLDIYRPHIMKLQNDSVQQVAHAALSLSTQRKGSPSAMLSQLEKVILLKTVNYFAETMEAVLVDVASVLEEMTLEPGETIFEKGAISRNMYIIVDGKVVVHNEGTILAELGESNTFGELALLEGIPQAASAKAVAETRLLRLDQESFYELIEDYGEVARGVMQVLAQRLRRSQIQQQREERGSYELLSDIHDQLNSL